MEFLLAIVIVTLAALGLAAGLMTGRGPVRSSCGGLSCIKGASCRDCPNRHSDKPEDHA